MSDTFDIKSEEALILDMQESIRTAILQVATKVNKSALTYMLSQKKWIPSANTSEAEKFFLDKIPKVLVDEISVAVYSAVGLSLQKESDSN